MDEVLMTEYYLVYYDIWNGYSLQNGKCSSTSLVSFYESGSGIVDLTVEHEYNYYTV